jgi:hypothetical protein
MGGGGNILQAVGEAWIGRDAWAKLDKIAARAGLDFDDPRSFAGIVEKIWADSVGSLGDLEHGAALMSFGDKFEPITNGACGESLQNTATEWGGDQGGEGFFPGGTWVGRQSAEEKGESGKTTKGVEVAEAEGSGGG